MGIWQEWSASHEGLPAILRATVLHAWLTHIHPFTDGNGRTARAITTLELVRAGFPPIIIKKPEKSRYLAGLADSDNGGDLAALLEFFVEKANGALLGLENAAKQVQGYSPAAARIRQRQEGYARIWVTSVQLFADMLEHYLQENVVPAGGKVQIRRLYDAFDVDSYLAISSGAAKTGGWAFIVSIEVPGVPKTEALCFFGHRSALAAQHFGGQQSVSLIWSRPNVGGYPKWRVWNEAPFGVEMTLPIEGGDRWVMRDGKNRIWESSGWDAAKAVGDALIEGF
jgi:hypothetical protein